MKNMKKYFAYSLQALLVIFFIAPGIMKLTGNPTMVETFERFGYSIWFMYFIGAAEVAGALGIAVGSCLNKILPKLAVIGLNIIMIGAFVSHLMADDPFIATIPALVSLALLNLYLHILRKKEKV